MPVSLEVAIAHCPWDAERRANLVAMRRRMESAQAERGRHIHISNDVEGPGNLGCRGNIMRSIRMAALAANANGSTHILSMSDDMLPCADFIPTLEDAISVHPDAMIGLYCARPGTLEAVQAGHPWVRTRSGIAGGSIVAPAGWFSRCAEWVEANLHRDKTCICHGWDDYPIAMYGRSIEPIEFWLTAPSLVQHMSPSTSVMKHNNANRVSRVFLGERRTPPGWWQLGGVTKDDMDVPWKKVEAHLQIRS